MDKINFEDLPSTNTPINANNLNAVQNNVDVAKLDKTIVVTATGTSCNDYKNDGVYWFGTSSVVPTDSPEIGTYGWLQVISDGGNNVRQIWHRSAAINGENEFKTFVRKYSANTDTWSDWKRYITTIDLDDYAPKNHVSPNKDYGVGNPSNYGHTKVINNLTTNSASEGQALNAYQGYVLNNKIVGSNVYNNSSGVAGNITITDITNARYIDIIYSAWSHYFSKRIYDAIGKKIVLDGMVFNSNTSSYNFAYEYTIAKTGLTRGNCGWMNRNYDSGNITGNNTADSNVKIHKIVAYF